MKYYSDLTHKMYESVEELETAELAAKQEKDERAQAAAEVKLAGEKVAEAYQAYKVACKERDKLLTDFCEKYGSYKTTVRSNDIKTLDPLSELLNFTFWGF